MEGVQVRVRARRRRRFPKLTLGKARETRLVDDLEFRLLLDSTMSGCDADVRHVELAEVELVGEILRSDPVNLDKTREHGVK